MNLLDSRRKNKQQQTAESEKLTTKIASQASLNVLWGEWYQLQCVWYIKTKALVTLYISRKFIFSRAAINKKFKRKGL